MARLCYFPGGLPGPIAKETPEQRKHGALSVETRFLNELDTVKGQGQAFDIPVIDLETFEIDDAILKIIPPHIAWEYRIVPVMGKQSTLFIAMADPTNVQALKDIRFLAGKYVIPIIAPESVIAEALRKHYGKEATKCNKTTLATDGTAGCGALREHGGTPPERIRTQTLTARRIAGNLCLLAGAVMAALRLSNPYPQGWLSGLLLETTVHDWMGDTITRMILALPASISQPLLSDLVSTVHTIAVWYQAALTMLFFYLLSRLIKG